MLHEGFEPNFDGFKLSNLTIDTVDNVENKIIFSGAYEGDSYSIEPMDWNIFAECHFIGIGSNDGEIFFYQELLSEAYIQKSYNNFKISYFIAFSALENYINERMNTHETKDRLSNIINSLFKNTPTPINNNQVYTSIMNDYSKYEEIRNKIAHGRQKVLISEEELNEFILFTLILISSAEGKGKTFIELSENV